MKVHPREIVFFHFFAQRFIAGLFCPSNCVPMIKHLDSLGQVHATTHTTTPTWTEKVAMTCFSIGIIEEIW